MKILSLTVKVNITPRQAPPPPYYRDHTCIRGRKMAEAYNDHNRPAGATSDPRLAVKLEALGPQEPVEHTRAQHADTIRALIHSKHGANTATARLLEEMILGQ